MKIFYLFTFFFIASISVSFSQCTTCAATYNGSGSTNFNLNGNQTLCITGNAGNLNINFNGSNNTICIADGVTWTQTNGLNMAAGTTVNVNNGTFNANGGANFNGSGSSINTGTSGTLNWPSGNSNGNNNITFNNSGTMNFNSTGDQSFSGIILNNTGTVNKSGTTAELLFGTSSVITNSGTINAPALENEEATTFNNSGTINVTNLFYNHGAINNQSTGILNVGSLTVGNKGPGKEFTNNGQVFVNGGDARFIGPGINNGGLVLRSGSNLILEKELSGTNGFVYLENGVSTISGGSFTGTQGFYDANNANPTVFDSGSTGSNTTNTPPTGTVPFSVKLISFSATQIENEVQLSWKAVDFESFSGFTIERSSDAKNFLSIGGLKEHEGTNSIFNFRDSKPMEGLNYYRLQMRDLDGSIEYSKIVALDFEFGGFYMFFENPVQNQELEIHTNSKSAQFRAIDDMGRQVDLKVSKTKDGYTIKPKSLYYETFILQMLENGKLITKKVVFN